MALLSELRRTVAAGRAALAGRASAGNPRERYRNDPQGYATDVLGVWLTPQQVEIAESLIRPPFRCLVPSANNVGKTFFAAAILIWWFDTRSPAIVRTTAPKFDQVRDLLWKEVRRLVRQAKQRITFPFLPKACRIERAEDDYAVGTTATGEGGWKGHHGPNQLFEFDEGTDVDGVFYTSTETMFSPPGHAWLVIFNPTDTSSHVYLEYSQATRGGKSAWHVVRLSALEHPNIRAELEGREPPVPHAIRLATLERRIPQTCQLVTAEDRKATDFQWPPEWAKEYCQRTGQAVRWWRPGPEAEATLLGIFPSQGAYSVWGDGDWQAACRVGLEPLPLNFDQLPEIGVDVARYGDDDTAIHARQGPCSLSHAQYNGLSGPEIVGRVIEEANRLARWWSIENGKRPLSERQAPIDWRDIPVKVDDTGVGGGVTDLLAEKGASVIGVNVQTNALDSERYPDKRSELWFTVAERARDGRLDLSRLSDEVLESLRSQALAPTYKLDSDARRVVEPKDKMKDRLKHSPDSLDALNLAFHAAPGIGELPTVISERANRFR